VGQVDGPVADDVLDHDEVQVLQGLFGSGGIGEHPYEVFTHDIKAVQGSVLGGLDDPGQVQAGGTGNLGVPEVSEDLFRAFV
jgi:hypothetical protein